MPEQVCPSCGQPTNFDLPDCPAIGAVYEKESEMFYLFYDNGTGYFDYASSHDTLEDAREAADQGMQTSQRITDDAEGKNIIWNNYARTTPLQDLVSFIESACAGHTMAGSPPPLFDELEKAAGGDIHPLVGKLYKFHNQKCGDCGGGIRTGALRFYCPECNL